MFFQHIIFFPLMESMCRSKKDKKDKKEKDNNIRSTFTCINTRKHPTI